MSVISLRNGVMIEKGIEKEDSPYYIVDYVQEKEWHLSIKFVAYITGRIKSWHKITSADVKECTDFLENNKLLAGSKLEKPVIPLYQKIMAWPLEIVKPHEFLESTKYLWGWLFTWKGIALLGSLLFLALYVLSGSYGRLFGYFGNYDGSGAYIVAALVLVKAAHEFGHAMAIVYYNGYVSSINVVFIGAMPLPKNDALRMHKTEYRERAIIGFAGIYIEAILALICAILWAVVDDGPLKVAFHFVAIVSLPLTFAVNLVPLMKFDGYYILSSLLKSPRLYENAVDSFRHDLYLLLGLTPQDIVITSDVKDGFLVVYGSMIFVWKILLPIGLATAITTLIDARAAYILALLPFYTMWILPMKNEKDRLIASYKGAGIGKVSSLGWCFLVVILTGAFWLVAPIHHKEMISGAVLRDHFIVRSSTEGVTHFKSEEGHVELGDILAKVVPLTTSQELAQAEIYDAKALAASISKKDGDVGSRFLVDKSSNARAIALANVEEGDVRAKQNGVWIPGETKPLIKRGDEIGRFYLLGSRIAAYVPVNYSYPSEVEALAIFPNGEVIEVKMNEKGVVNDTSILPKWLDVAESDRSFLVFESESIDREIPEMPIKVLMKRKYSILVEWGKKITTSRI